MTLAMTYKGIIRGKMIELESETGLPDGVAVSVIIEAQRQPPEGLLLAFGSCVDEADSLDEFVRQTYAARKSETPRDQGLET